jgi:hypothetical protein
MNPLRAINEAARPVSTLPPGTQFARIAIAQQIAVREGANTVAVAESLWGEKSIPALALKQAVSAGTLSNMSALADYGFAAREFVTALRSATILGKLSGMRRAPLNVRFPKATAGATIGWVGEAKPLPITGLSITSDTIDVAKLAGIIVTTSELARLANPAAEGMIRDDLLAAAAEMSDVSFIDPTRAGEAGVSPASVTYGAASIAPSGSNTAALRVDLAKLFDAVTGDLFAPYLITDRRQAIKMALMDTPLTQGVKANGGVLAGVPLIVSASSPTDSDEDSPPTYKSTITLLDAADVLLADEGHADIAYSEHSALQMDSAPDAPPTGSTVLVSLFQHNLSAWKLTRYINWKMRRSGRVAYITGAAYAG